MTQQELADACGLSNAAISKMEAGLADNVYAPNLFAVADVLRVNARWLATGEEDKNNDLAGLSDAQRAALAAIISTMKK